MNHVVLLRKKNGEAYYYSADESFEGSYPLVELLELFPHSFLLIVNDDSFNSNDRIINRKKLKFLFDVHEDTVPCHQCAARNNLDCKYCKRCGEEQLYYDITCHLSPSINRQFSFKDYLENGFWTGEKYE